MQDFIITKYDPNGKVVLNRFHMAAHDLVHAIEQFQKRFGVLNGGERIEVDCEDI